MLAVLDSKSARYNGKNGRFASMAILMWLKTMLAG